MADAFDPARAYGSERARDSLIELGAAFPDRRPGSEGDRALADRAAGVFRASGMRVERSTSTGRTIDGEADIETVQGIRPGLSPRQIVVLAHRDSASSPGLAELSGTAADRVESMVLAAGGVVGLFPEGTLSDGRPLRARSGAGRLAVAVPQAAVVSVALTGAVDMVRFPRRPRLRVEFFVSAAGAEAREAGDAAPDIPLDVRASLAEEGPHRLAAVVAGDVGVEVLPDALDAVRVGAVGRQEVEDDAVAELLEAVRGLNRAGATVVVVEQSVNIALTLAHRAYFLEKGEVRFSGRTADLLARPDILRSVFLEGAATRHGETR